MAFGRTYDPNVRDDERIPVGAARRTDAGRRTPDARPEKTEDGRKEGGERYATLAEVQAVINSLVDSIKSGFVTKSDHLAVVNNFNRYIAVLQSKIPSEIDIKETARKQIPSCLRDLEQAGRQGNVLMLEPGGADGTGTDKDSAYWGTVKAASAGMDWSKLSLGFTISGTTVTILAGEIDRITVAQADVVVANDNYVYVRRTIADDTMLVVAAASVPADDATYKYYRLYQFSVTGEGEAATAAMKFELRPFDIEAGGGGLTVENDQVLYKGVFLREYDAEGVIVEIGDELNPADYGDQAEYEAALAEIEHTLKPTWDYMRFI